MNVSESILQGLQEAVEFEKGSKSKATTRIVEIASLPNYHGHQIKEIIMRKSLSQATFAMAMGVILKGRCIT